MNGVQPIKIRSRCAFVMLPILATVSPLIILCLLFLTTFAFSGCAHYRTMCVASVGDVGPVVETKYRYCFKDEKLKKSGDFMKLKKAYPNVFSDDGIPFTIRSHDSEKKWKKSYGWTFSCPYACSLLTLPMISTSEWNFDYEVDLVDMPDAHTEFSTCFRSDHAFAMWTPSPMLFCIGNLGDLGDAEKYKGCRIFSYHNVQFVGDVIWESKCDPLNGAYLNDAYAYGLAVTLKKMEDAGLVDLLKLKNQNRSIDGNSRVGESIELLNFEREEGCDFAYSFRMRNRKGDMTLRDSREVRKALMKMVRDDYLALNPYLASSMLIVDFPVYNLKGDEIAGRAIVLRLDVKSLEYDPHTRRGVMRIRLDEGQFAEARQYVRRNIEMIVRDKGIALETGKIPDAAEFRLLDEKMSDGLLEVTFKAE